PADGVPAGVTVHRAGPGGELEVLAEVAAAADGALVIAPEFDGIAELSRQAVDRATGPFLLAGDLNTPESSAIYRNNWSEFTNAFSTSGFGWGYTRGWPKPHWLVGVRIDHVLAGPGWRFRRC